MSQYRDGGVGGAIAVTRSEMSVSQSLFTGNTAMLNGGAMHLDRVTLVSRANVFRSNTATAGGALYATTKADVDGSAAVDGCSFLSNTAGARGGGIVFDVQVSDNAWADCVLMSCSRVPV